MSNKDGVDFYHTLSRKELQSLCKKYGLPARKSSSEMAESLFSHFKKKNLGLACSEKIICGIQEVLLPPSSLTTLRAEVPLALTGNALEDSCQLRFNPEEEGGKGNRHCKCNAWGSFMGADDKKGFGGSMHYLQGTYESQFVSRSAGSAMIDNELCASLSGRVEDAPQFHCGHISKGVCLRDNISAIRTYTKVPASFEFYVNSEEGIELCVDLNSSPVDWIKKYKNQVSLCNNAHNPKSGSLHQELGRFEESNESNEQKNNSFLQSEDSGEKIMDVKIQPEGAPGLVMEENTAEIGCPEGVDKSLTPLPSRSLSAVLVQGLDCVGDQGPISCEPCSDVQVQIISNMESCTKNGSCATLISDITDNPTEKTACNFAINSISDGSLDLIVIERQNPKHDDGICENSILQNNGNRGNNCVASGCLASCYAEMQLSETGNYHNIQSCSPNENGKLLDLGHPNHNLVTEQTTSSENYHSGSHLPTCSEEQEWSNIICGKESSVSSQVDNSVGNTCLTSGNLELNEEFMKKRSFIYSEVQERYSKRESKILRSMKHSAGPRRSMRLVSK